MIDLIEAWLKTTLGSYFRMAEFAVLAAILALSAYGGYHTRAILDEAAVTKRNDKVVASIPKVITKTQTLTRIVHDSSDTCSKASAPAAVLGELH